MSNKADFLNMKLGDIIEAGQLFPNMATERMTAQAISVGEDQVTAEVSLYGVRLGDLTIRRDNEEVVWRDKDAI